MDNSIIPSVLDAQSQANLAHHIRHFLTTTNSLVASGTANIPGGSTGYAIAHGLKGKPKWVNISSQTTFTTPSTVELAYVDQAKPADNTNIYVNSSGTHTLAIYWAASLI